MLKRITRHNGICDDERSRGQGEEKDTASHYYRDRQRLQLFKGNSLNALFFNCRNWKHVWKVDAKKRDALDGPTPGN